MDDPGYYIECGGTMPNKLGISDAHELENIEYDITAKNTQKILKQPCPKSFDFNLLLNLHRQLLGDIYDFAGKVRTTRLFLDLLCNNAGYFIDFSLASRRAILYADTTAFAGDLRPLKDLYRQIIIKI